MLNVQYFANFTHFTLVMHYLSPYIETGCQNYMELYKLFDAMCDVTASMTDGLQ